jgi:GT2 family glycosyltransferase
LTRNRRRRVLATVERLLELPERPEVVVVDNASQDGTPEALGRVHPGVRVVRMRRNIGAGARNAGVRALDTELVALSDDDSWWAPGALARAAEAFRTRPSLGLVQARILVGDEGRLDPTCAAMRESPLPAPPGLEGPAVLGFIACGAVLRRTAFLEAGGFDARLGIGAEEKLLALDMAARGWQLVYLDAVVAHHHPEPGGDRSGRARQVIRNELWTAWLRRRLPGAIATSVRLTATAVRHGQLRTLVEAARGAPWALRRRRALPPSVDRAVALVYGAPGGDAAGEGVRRARREREFAGSRPPGRGAGDR